MSRRMIHRRTMLQASAAASALLGASRFDQMLAAQEAPAAIKRDGARPAIAQGVASGDVGGQGWGIDRDRGGLKIFETMRSGEPDLFIHLGDTIYADNPIPPEVTLDDGTLWKNMTTEPKAHVAQTLDDFRGCYLYNLL